MSFIHLDNREKKLLREAITLRIKTIGSDPTNDEVSVNHITKLEIALQELDYPISDLKPGLKAILVGCVRDLVIHPYEDQSQRIDYRLLQKKENKKDLFETIITGVNVINKFKRNKDKPIYPSFKRWLENKLDNVNQI